MSGFAIGAIGGDGRYLWVSAAPMPGHDPDMSWLDWPRSRRACIIPDAGEHGLAGRGCGFLLRTSAMRSDWREALSYPADLPDPRAFFVRFSEQGWAQGIAEISAAYGLSAREGALAGALAECGDFTRAYERAGFDFVAARNALARIRAKLGTRNLPQTVDHLILLLMPSPAEGATPSDAVLADLLDISERELAMARELAAGASRQDIADAHGVSLATVKNALSSVYETLDVGSAPELASLLAQSLRVAEGLLDDPPDGADQLATARVRSLDRDGRRVGWSVYGEADAPALLVVHSSVCARHPPSRLVRRLCLKGWRVLAVDRPGFGDTDKAPRPGIDAQVETAAADLAAVCQAEGIAELVLLARSNGQMGVALTEALPGLVARTVMVNPTPPVVHTPVDRGPLGAIKRRFARDPRSIRLMIGLLLRLANKERLRSAMRRSFAHSPPDLAGTDDPVMIEDYLRASLPLRASLAGYVTENEGWSKGWDPAPVARAGGIDAPRYELVFARHFVLHDPEPALRHFERSLGGPQVTRVENAGHMMMYTHADWLADYIGRAP